METLVFCGRTASDWLTAELGEKAQAITKKLVFVNLGQDPAGEGYLRAVQKRAGELGIEIRVEELDNQATFTTFQDLLDQLYQDSEVGGIIPNFAKTSLLYPRREEIANLVAMEMDADYLSAEFEKDPLHQPSVVRAVLTALEVGLQKAGLKPADQPKIAVVGCEGFWGQRIVWGLRNGGLTNLVLIDQQTDDKANRSHEADVLITAVGQPELVTGDWVKEGAVVIDLGYGQKDGRACGDVQMSSVDGKATFITPVPGGIGPLAVGFVLANFIDLVEEKNES